jgi:hypothetical protein
MRLGNDARPGADGRDVRISVDVSEPVETPAATAALPVPGADVKKEEVRSFTQSCVGSMS